MHKAQGVKKKIENRNSQSPTASDKKQKQQSKIEK